MKKTMEFDPPLDDGIRSAVLALQAAGIETFESCEGGPDHAYPEPTIRFHGDYAEGFKALSIALRAGLRVGLFWTANQPDPGGK
jgi:hypothetical protein